MHWDGHRFDHGQTTATRPATRGGVGPAAQGVVGALLVPLSGGANFKNQATHSETQDENVALKLAGLVRHGNAIADKSDVAVL